MLCLIDAGCRLAFHKDPAAAFERIQNDWMRGNLTTAEREVMQARQDYAKHGNGWDTKFRILEAQILTYQGESKKVIALLEQSPPLDPGNARAAIRSNTLRALAFGRLEQADQSERALRQAQSLSDANHGELSEEVFLTRGVIDLHYERLSSAEGWLARSVETSRQRGDKFLEATALLDLGVAALRAEHYDEALRRFRAASDLAETIQANSDVEVALANQGWAYYALGDYEKALETFQQAEKQAESLGAQQSVITNLEDAGLSYFELHNLDAAVNCYQKALTAATAIEDRKVIGALHLDLGFLFLRQGRLELAQRQSEAALKSAREMRSKSAEVEPLFLQALVADREKKPEVMRDFLQLEQTVEIEPSLKWRIENTIANEYAGRGQLHQAEPWYQKSLRTFETQRSTLKDDEQKLPFFANADSLYKDYADYLIQSHRNNEALLLLDAARARTLQDGLQSAAASAVTPGLKRVSLSQPYTRQRSAISDDPRTVARKLDSTILFYSLGPKRSHLWSINAAGTHGFDLPPQADIEARISNYQKAILRGDDTLHSSVDASSLYETLVAPAASTIAAGSRVIIIPDGALTLLNFETLVKRNTQGEHYWIEDVTVTNASSIRLLSASCTMKSQAAVSKKLGRLLLVGDPLSPAPEYPALANASVEVSSVEKHFAADSRRVLTQANATAEAYSASSPDQFEYIHFVAHATASRLSPLDSAVVLSASPSQPDKYKLYARDILQQPLHAELVVISSCYGSGSRAYAGEGLVGLSWAFLRAGSHHVIGALWEADDASTARLMDRLYTRLGDGERADDALRDAKLALLHSSGIYRKPLYWAAFQLQSGS